MIKHFENWTNSVHLYAVGFTEVEPDALDRPDKAHIQFSLPRHHFHWEAAGFVRETYSSSARIKSLGVLM